MKKAIIISAAILISFSACKAPKSITEVLNRREVSVPFNKKEYKSDNEYFRAVANGISPNENDARLTSLNNANTRLALEIDPIINVALRGFTDRIDNDKDKQEFEGRFTSQNWNFADLQIHGVRVMDEKMFIESNGAFNHYVVIEVSVKSVLDGLESKLSDEKLRTIYDQEIFAEEVRKELERRRANEK